MVLLSVIPFILAAGITFVVINVMTPVLYDMWVLNLSNEVTSSSLKQAGDNILGMWRIMSFVVPGIIILWGFALANRKRVREEAF